VTFNDPIARSRADVRALLRDVEAVYALGGPPIGAGAGDNWDPVEAHGYILAVLDHHDMTNWDRYVEALRDARIDYPAGLRALLRLVVASGAMAALSWVLDEPDAFHPGGHATSRAEVIESASSIAFWGSSTQ